jgi:uncharacterized iron-regulated membrane protein
MAVNWRVWMRKGHRWAAILIALPFLLVILTGLLLQLKKDWSWVQPPTARGTGKAPAVSFDAILEAAKSAPEAGIQSWADVDRLDVRPDRGLVKVQAKSGWEVQVDTGSGKVLQTEYRRSDLIETLHDGSWFGDRAKLLVFLPVAVVVLGLWVSGVYLFILPWGVRWRRRRERRAAAHKGGRP